MELFVEKVLWYFCYGGCNYNVFGYLNLKLIIRGYKIFDFYKLKKVLFIISSLIRVFFDCDFFSFLLMLINLVFLFLFFDMLR